MWSFMHSCGPSCAAVALHLEAVATSSRCDPLLAAVVLHLAAVTLLSVAVVILYPAAAETCIVYTYTLISKCENNVCCKPAS